MKVSVIEAIVHQDLNTTVFDLNCDVRADVNQDLDITWSLDPNTCPEHLIDTEIYMSNMKVVIDTDRYIFIDSCIVYCYAKVEDMTSCRKAKLDLLGGVIEERDCSELVIPLTTTDIYSNITSGTATNTTTTITTNNKNNNNIIIFIIIIIITIIQTPTRYYHNNPHNEYHYYIY